MCGKEVWTRDLEAFAISRVNYHNKHTRDRGGWPWECALPCPDGRPVSAVVPPQEVPVSQRRSHLRLHRACMLVVAQQE